MAFNRNRIVIILLIGVLRLFSPVQAQALTIDQLVNEYPDVSSVTHSGDLVDKIRANITLLLSENKHRDYPGVILAEDVQKILWFKGMEISTLSETFPFLDAAQKSSLQDFLKIEVHDYLLSKQYREYESQGDVSTKLGDMSFDLNWWQWGSTDWEDLYGLWAYAHYSGDSQTIADNWADISRLYSEAHTDRKKAISAGIYVNSRNSQIAGRIGYARMARTLYDRSQDTAYQDVYRSTVSTLSSEITMLNDQASNGPFMDQICGSTATDWCPSSPAQNRNLQIFYTQFDFMTPELGRYMKSNYLSQTQTVIDDALKADPWWFMASYNLTQTGGEGYHPSPAYAYQILQARAQILSVSPVTLRKEFPWQTEYATLPHYWDIFTYANLLTLIRSSEEVRWTDILVSPTSPN